MRLPAVKIHCESYSMLKDGHLKRVSAEILTNLQYTQKNKLVNKTKQK